MLWVGKIINENYGLELSAFYQYRIFSDGISFFDFNCSWDRFEGDHTPAFNLKLSILNIALIDFNIYYLHHRNECENCDGISCGECEGE